MRYPEADQAIRRIRELSRTKASIVVAVDGRSGTGKSTLAEYIARQVGGTWIDQDDFYAGGHFDEWRALPACEKAERIIDWRRLRAEVLEPLLAGKAATWHPFDWETLDGLAPVSVTAHPSNVIVLDGTYSGRPELSALVDLSILVVLPEAVRQERLRSREGDEYDSEWQPIWDEAEDYYFAVRRSPESFDIVIHRPVDTEPTERDTQPD